MIPYILTPLTILLCVQLAQCFQIHELMDDHELDYIFGSNFDAIPSYDIAYVTHSRDKRGLKAFIVKLNTTEKVVKYLKQHKSLLVTNETIVWLAKEIPGNEGVTYDTLPAEILHDSVEVFINHTYPSSIVSKRSVDGELTFYGFMEDLTIRPVPDRLRRALLKSDHYTKRGVLDIDEGGVPHIIMRRSVALLHENKRAFERIHKREATKDAKTVYPAFIITTDYWRDAFIVPTETTPETLNATEIEKLHRRLVQVIAFWSAVNLMFLDFKDPRIKIRIRGIIIGAGSKATPYINKSRNRFYPEDAVDDMAAYYNDIVNTENLFEGIDYHAIITMTDAAPVTKELAMTMGTVCDKTVPNYETVVIVLDSSLHGVEVVKDAAHEVAHLFNAQHDDDTQLCKDPSGYLMQAYVKPITVKNSKWSRCTIDAVQKYLNKVTCMDEPPEEDEYKLNPMRKVMTALLPGRLTSAWEQCQNNGYDGSCPPDAHRCVQLKCFKIEKGAMVVEKHRTPATGTECGVNMMCVNRQCVIDPQPPRNHWYETKTQHLEQEQEQVCSDNSTIVKSKKFL